MKQTEIAMRAGWESSYFRVLFLHSSTREGFPTGPKNRAARVRTRRIAPLV